MVFHGRIWSSGSVLELAIHLRNVLFWFYNRLGNQHTEHFGFIDNGINIQSGAEVPLALSGLCVTLYLLRFALWAVEV